MRFLSNKEKKELQEKLPKGYEVSKKDILKEHNSMLYLDEKKFLIIKEGRYLPHLNSLPDSTYKSVCVDKGAIPFIAKGADLMRPGIQMLDDGIEKDDIVVVRDENKKKAFAIGFSLVSSEEMKEQAGGKSLTIYHYIGDEYY